MSEACTGDMLRERWVENPGADSVPLSAPVQSNTTSNKHVLAR